MKSDSPVFVVGMPRSGTTLIQSLIASHPDISIASETHFLSKRYVHLVRSDFDQFWDYLAVDQDILPLGLEVHALKKTMLEQGVHSPKEAFKILLMEYARLEGKSRWGEKSPKHYAHIGTLLSWFPTARVVWIVRDPRSVCSSLLNVYWRSTDKGKRWEPLGARRARRLYYDAKTWQEHVDLLTSKWMNDPRVVLIRYEDLVTDPGTALNGVSQILDVDLGEVADESRDQEYLYKRLDPSSGAKEEWLLKHYSQAVRPVSKQMMTKWRERLERSEVRLIEAACAGGMEVIGYERICFKFRAPQDLIQHLLLKLWSAGYWRAYGMRRSPGHPSRLDWHLQQDLQN